MTYHLVQHPILLGLYQLLDTLAVDEATDERLNLDETVVHLEEVLFVGLLLSFGSVFIHSLELLIALIFILELIVYVIIGLEQLKILVNLAVCTVAHFAPANRGSSVLLFVFIHDLLVNSCHWPLEAATTLVESLEELLVLLDRLPLPLVLLLLRRLLCEDLRGRHAGHLVERARLQPAVGNLQLTSDLFPEGMHIVYGQHELETDILIVFLCKDA